MPKPTDEGKDDTVIGVRFEAPLLARVDAYLETLKAGIPGARLSRSDAIRACVVAQLDAKGIEAAPASKGERKAKAKR